jgi:hypothetical protein
MPKLKGLVTKSLTTGQKDSLMGGLSALFNLLWLRQGGVIKQRCAPLGATGNAVTLSCPFQRQHPYARQGQAHWAVRAFVVGVTRLAMTGHGGHNPACSFAVLNSLAHSSIGSGSFSAVCGAIGITGSFAFSALSLACLFS